MLKLDSSAPECLSSLAPFKGLRVDDLQRFTTGAAEMSVPCGTIVFREGDVCTGLHFVVSGQVKLSFHTDAGYEQVVRLVGDGGSFEEVALFLSERYAMTAETIADTTLLHVARDVLVAEVERNAEFGGRVIRELCHQLRQRTLDLHSYVLLTGTQRVVGYLLSRLPDGGCGKPVAVVLPVKKGIIASRLNLTHEHFSRILHELAAAALIEVDGRDVLIRDVGRLRALYAG